MGKKRTHEEFIEIVKNLVGDEYKILSKYVNSTTYVKILHTSCGHEYNVKPYKFLDNRRCPMCANRISGLMRRKRNSEFIEEAFKIHGDDYVALSEYVTGVGDILMKHVSCGHEYLTSPREVLTGHKCPNCAKNKKKDTESFLKEVRDTTNGEYELLSDYINSTIKVKIRHNCEKCDNYTYDVTPAMFSSGKRCPKCGNNLKKTQEEFLSQVIEQVGDEYTFLENYKGTHTKIRVRHNSLDCNYNEYLVEPNSFFTGRGCNICAMRQNGINLRKTQSEFEKEIFEMYRDEYSVIGKYITDGDKVLIKHNCDKCSRHEWLITPNDILHNRRCPKCRASKLEETISKILDSYNIEYIQQYKFDKCKNKYKLPFDFYIPTLNLCIEAQGQQHYKPIEFFGGVEKFKLQKKLDKIKKNFCIKNNIQLLEIPYWEIKNIKDILIKELKL